MWQETNGGVFETSSGAEDGDDDEVVDLAGSSGIPKDMNHEDEYLDEDRLTTVTVEAVDVSKDGLKAINSLDDEDEEGDDEGNHLSTSRKREGGTKNVSETTNDLTFQGRTEKRAWTKDAPTKAKKRKKAFRYESKADRRVEQFKQRAAKARKKKRGMER